LQPRPSPSKKLLTKKGHIGLKFPSKFGVLEDESFKTTRLLVPKGESLKIPIMDKHFAFLPKKKHKSKFKLK
jgi:hypothetical protein